MRLVHMFCIQAVITALALCVVWQGSLARRAGYRQEELRRKIELYAAEAHEYRAQTSKLRSPQRILYLVNYLALDLKEASTNPAGVAVNSSPGSGRNSAEAVSEVARLTPSH